MLNRLRVWGVSTNVQRTGYSSDLIGTQDEVNPLVDEWEGVPFVWGLFTFGGNTLC